MRNTESPCIIAHVPARIGSVRVKRKNLVLLHNRPLISYVLDALKESTIPLDYYVNSESDEILEVGKSLGALSYKRKEELAHSDVVQDDFNYDFICNKNPDVLVLVNPVCPLIKSEDIDNVVNYFLNNDYDTVVTTTSHGIHSFYKNEPINFSIKNKLEKTQDLDPVVCCNWAICVWDAKKFKKHYEEFGHAVFVGNIGTFELPLLRSIKISNHDDLELVKVILKSR